MKRTNVLKTLAALAIIGLPAVAFASPIVDPPTPKSDSPRVVAAASDLDFSFGSSGVTIADFGGADQISALTVQNDGKIVAVGQTGSSGNMAIARFTTTGQLDTSFNGTGKLIVGFGGGAVAVHGTDIFVAGQTTDPGTNNAEWALIKLASNGTPDASFGSNGKVTTDLGTTTSAAINGIVIQSDGKPVVAGYRNNGGIDELTVGRYLTTGLPDPGFASVATGRLVVMAGHGEAVVLKGTNILVGGTSSTGLMAVARVTPGGVLDSSFGVNGVSTSTLSASLKGIGLQSDGKIVAAGKSGGGFTTIRFGVNGGVDTSFGVNGAVVKNVGFINDNSAGVVVQQNDKIVTGGSVCDCTSDIYFTAIRLNADGTDDTGFGPGGISEYNPGTVPYGKGMFALALQPDGKILLAGRILTSDYDFAILRLNGDPATPSCATEFTVARAPAAVSVSGQVLWGAMNTDQANSGVNGADVLLGCTKAKTDSQGKFTVSSETGPQPLNVNLSYFDFGGEGALRARGEITASANVNIVPNTPLLVIQNFGQYFEGTAIGRDFPITATIKNGSFSGVADVRFSDKPDAKPLRVNAGFDGASFLMGAATGSKFTYGSYEMILNSFSYRAPQNTFQFNSDVVIPFGGKPFTATVAGGLTQNGVTVSGTKIGVIDFGGQPVTGTVSVTQLGNDLFVSAEADNQHLIIGGVPVTATVTGIADSGGITLTATGTSVVRGITLTYSGITPVPLNGQFTNYQVRGTVQLPNQTAVESFGATVDKNATSLNLGIDNFEFDKRPASAQLSYASATNELKLSGQGAALIGGDVLTISVNSVITDSTVRTVTANATRPITDGEITLGLTYNTFSNELAGNGSYTVRSQPCPNERPRVFTFAVQATRDDVTVSGQADLPVSCATGLGTVDSVTLNVTGMTKLKIVSLTLTGHLKAFDAIPLDPSVMVSSDGKSIDLRVNLLIFSWGVSSGKPGTQEVQTQAAAPIRILLTDAFGRRIGYDRATAQIVNEVPGAVYQGIVNGADSFSLPGMIGAFAATVTSPIDADFTLGSFANGGAATDSLTVHLIANQPTSLLVRETANAAGKPVVRVSVPSYVALVPGARR